MHNKHKYMHVYLHIFRRTKQNALEYLIAYCAHVYSVMLENGKSVKWLFFLIPYQNNNIIWIYVYMPSIFYIKILDFEEEKSPFLFRLLML